MTQARDIWQVAQIVKWAATTKGMGVIAKELGMTIKNEKNYSPISIVAGRLILFAVAILFGGPWVGPVAAQKVRVAMPAKSMTFLNFYVGDKFGIYKGEGLDLSLEVIKTEVGVAGMVAGEVDYTSAIGSAMRAAATGMPIKATMFTLDRVLVYMFAKPTIRSIEELKGGKVVATTGLLATPTYAAKVMARAHGVNPDKDLTFIATGDVATSLAALRGGVADVAMLSIPFNFRAEELGFRNLGSAVEYLQTPFAGLGATDAKMKNNPAQVKRMIRATLKSMDFTKDPANQEKVAALLMDEFKLERKTAGLALRDIVKAFTKDGTTSPDAVMAEIKEIREQVKIKADIPIGQVVDFKLLDEVLDEMRREKK
ncbi:MAG: ABC transporter substrate-binding protein [Deltaproteobacteria bacterium]|nr:ABC transporter substrate-binding protein [Deltaproteobacteria bacterium]